VGLTELEQALPAGERLLLDTTLLAAYLDTSEEVHPAARHVLDGLVVTGRNEAIVSMVTMMEILVRPFRQSPPGHQTVLAFISHHANLQALPLDLQMAQEAASLRASHRLSPPDALVVATGMASQVGYLVTNDRAWRTKLHPIRHRIQVVTLIDYAPFS
jgi:predicted nucleic acid-binding protein